MLLSIWLQDFWRSQRRSWSLGSSRSWRSQRPLPLSSLRESWKRGSYPLDRRVLQARMIGNIVWSQAPHKVLWATLLPTSTLPNNCCLGPSGQFSPNSATELSVLPSFCWLCWRPYMPRLTRRWPHGPSAVHWSASTPDRLRFLPFRRGFSPVTALAGPLHLSSSPHLVSPGSLEVAPPSPLINNNNRQSVCFWFNLKFTTKEVLSVLAWLVLARAAALKVVRFSNWQAVIKERFANIGTANQETNLSTQRVGVHLPFPQ